MWFKKQIKRAVQPVVAEVHAVMTDVIERTVLSRLDEFHDRQQQALRDREQMLRNQEQMLRDQQQMLGNQILLMNQLLKLSESIRITTDLSHLQPLDSAIEREPLVDD